MTFFTFGFSLPCYSEQFLLWQCWVRVLHELKPFSTRESLTLTSTKIVNEYSSVESWTLGINKVNYTCLLSVGASICVDHRQVVLKRYDPSVWCTLFSFIFKFNVDRERSFFFLQRHCGKKGTNMQINCKKEFALALVLCLRSTVTQKPS